MGRDGGEGREEATWHIFCTAKHERRVERKEEEDREGKEGQQGAGRRDVEIFASRTQSPARKTKEGDRGKDEEGGGKKKNFGRCSIKWAQKILGLGTEQEKRPPRPQKILSGKPLKNLPPPGSLFLLLTFKLTLAMQPTPLLFSTTHDTWHGCYTFLLQGQKNRRGETPFPLVPCAPPRYFCRYQQRAREKEEERERERPFLPPSLCK